MGRVCCRPDVNVITANPKTAGVARWNFLALWGHRAAQGDEPAQEYVTGVRILTVSGINTTSNDRLQQLRIFLSCLCSVHAINIIVQVQLIEITNLLWRARLLRTVPGSMSLLWAT